LFLKKILSLAYLTVAGFISETQKFRVKNRLEIKSRGKLNLSRSAKSEQAAELIADRRSADAEG
jgi:hypothetical protein